MNVITHTFVGLKCLTETKIQILCDQRFHIVEMGCQMLQLLSAHIVRPTIAQGKGRKGIIFLVDLESIQHKLR